MTDYVILDGFERMDFDKITAMLKDTWWSPGIKETEVRKGAINSALVVGAFTAGNRQIGYARVISDKTRFAYIMDVVVDDGFRKQGIGRAMITVILRHPELQDVYQWMLWTRDAHDVYRKTGFAPIADPDSLMEIRKPRPKR